VTEAVLDTGAPSDRDLDLVYYLDLLWRGRWLIIATSLVALGLGIFSGYLQVPQYRATALLQIEPPTPTFLSVTDALVSGRNYWQDVDFFNTQYQILKSKSLGNKVVARLKLDDRPPFKGMAEPGPILMGHVAIEPIEQTRLVQVHVTHEVPEEARLWADTLADVYIEQSLTSRVESAKRAYDWLQERLSATQQNMRDAQNKLYKSYQSQDLFVPEGSVSAVTASITKLNEDFIAAQSRRIALEAALNQIDDMQKQGVSLDAVPQIASDSMILALSAQIANLGLELTRLREKYKEAHPEIQKVQAQIEQEKKAREARVSQVIEGLKTEFGQIQKREHELKAAIDTQKAQAATQSRKATELETLKKEADSAKNLYEVLLQKLNETDIAASIRNNNVSLVERASLPTRPVRPNRPRIAGMALLMGLLAGMCLVFGRDYFDNTLKGPEDVERYLHMDLLAAVPRYDDPGAPLVTEAYQNLRTALLFGRKDDAGQVVLVTGTAPQEGKTTTLVNIGRLLAASGERTVVLDFDLRRAQLHSRLGLTREPGLMNFFIQQEELESLVKPTSTPGLFALTTGPLPPSPPAILARKSVGDLMAALRKRFDWVLVDSPPLASVTDALLLARHADQTVVVIQHNKVDKKLVKRCVAALRKITPSLLGAVLNVVDVKAQGYYYYYYQHDQGPRAVPRSPAEADTADVTKA
jgi:capsular exopolysaccharide synthesis family protein